MFLDPVAMHACTFRICLLSVHERWENKQSSAKQNGVWLGAAIPLYLDDDGDPEHG